MATFAHSVERVVEYLLEESKEESNFCEGLTSEISEEDFSQRIKEHILYDVLVIKHGCNIQAVTEDIVRIYQEYFKDDEYAEDDLTTDSAVRSASPQALDVAAAVRSVSPIKIRCSYCKLIIGHNRVTCQMRLEHESAPREERCSYCKQVGHRSIRCAMRILHKEEKAANVCTVCRRKGHYRCSIKSLDELIGSIAI